VRVREGADQPFGDPEALHEGEGRIGRLGLETVGVSNRPPVAAKPLRRSVRKPSFRNGSPGERSCRWRK